MMLALSVAMLIPLLLLIILLDEWRSRFLLGHFAWGSVAGFIAYSLNMVLVDRFDISLQELSIQFAPVTEEFIKGIPLFIIFILGWKVVKQRHIIFAAICIGIGFSVVENYWYLMIAGNMSIAEATFFVATRSISTTIMHGLATGAIGLSIYAVSRGTFDSLGYPKVFILVGYVLAVMFHAYFNLFVQFGILGEMIAIIVSVLLYVIAGCGLRWGPILSQRIANSS